MLRNARSQISALLGPHFYYDHIISTTRYEVPFTATAKGRDATDYTLSIRYVSTIEPGSDQFCWYLNILIKLQQKALGLKQLTNKPSFYNADQAIELPSIGLSIWNGYKATVNSIGSEMLMCLDICSKVINNKNVLDAMDEINERNPEIKKKKITDSLYNQIVMTMYNKRFYRVLFEAVSDQDKE